MRSLVGLFLAGIFSLLTSCRPEVPVIDYSMIIDSYKLSFYEPSGLSYSADKESFYTVSDRGFIYQISLSGQTLKELPYTGDDFEGITVDPLSSDIYICEEGKGNLVKLTEDGNIQNSYHILDNGYNNGLEGLTYNNNLDVFYLLKEMSDGLLIKYDLQNDTQTQIKLNFALDYSGIFYNSTSNKLWIVSDESRTLTQCTLDGVKIKDYILPIAGVEGIVVNDDETVAYVVSDPNNKLYKLDLTRY